MVSMFTLLSTLGAITAITVGIFFLSPIPKNLGLYRFIASKKIDLVGLTPAFHHGIEWKYTFEELYKTCPTQISGQNALITGANSGVGYETARALALCGVNVTLACRNAKKCSIAADKIKEDSKDNGYENEISTMIVDMSSLKSVQQFSKQFLAKYENKSNETKGDGGEGGDGNGSRDKSLDMLYLNAGIGSSTVKENKVALSEDGIELVFATNYVGHHLMYRMLEPLLIKSKMARVIQTSSAASFDTFDDKVATSLESINNRPTDNLADMKYYGQSKLAQIVWAKHVTTRLIDAGIHNIYVNACHPGAVDTLIWDKAEAIPDFLMPFVNYLRKDVMWTGKEGALTLLYLGVATDQLKAKNIRGKYFHPQAQEVVNPLSLDEKLQKDLWDFSEDLVSKFL